MKDKKKKILLLISKLGSVERLKLFKMAFLISQELEDFYSFVPYKYGPYSFEMDKDIRKLIKDNYIINKGNKLIINKKFDFSNSENNEIIDKIIDKFSKKTSSEVLDYVYQKYPYFCQNSKIRKSKNNDANNSEKFIYTIGYQNLSIDKFVNILIRKGIKYIIDVRNNPFSFKYGFAKYWLEKNLPAFGINYVNFSKLGIPKKYRDSLNSSELWEKYKEIIDYSQVDNAIKILAEHPSALMCFEANVDECHRHVLSDLIHTKTKEKVIDFNIETTRWEERAY